MEEILKQEGPTVITKYQCKGCYYLETEEWEFYGENDDRDSGTDAKCGKLEKHIASYWCSSDSSPKWCPFIQESEVMLLETANSR